MNALTVSFCGGTLNYIATPVARKKGTYRVETQNWKATFTATAANVTWGLNREHFSLTQPERVIAAFQAQLQ